MRKEIFIAIFAGILIGLLITFGVWRINSSVKLKPTLSDIANSQKSEDKKTADPVLSPTDNKFSLINIENNQIFTQSPIKISGITTPHSKVIISGENEDYISQIQPDGSFEEEVVLQGGINKILISSIDSDGKLSEEELTVVYSTEFAKDLNNI